MGKRALTPSVDFNRFWAAYPRRVARLDALKAWHQLNPSSALVDEMLATLAWQSAQPSWLRDGRQFVPYPASWIRAGRWMDEPDQPVGRLQLAEECPHTPPCAAPGRWQCRQLSALDKFKNSGAA